VEIQPVHLDNLTEPLTEFIFGLSIDRGQLAIVLAVLVVIAWLIWRRSN